MQMEIIQIALGWRGEKYSFKVSDRMRSKLGDAVRRTGGGGGGGGGRGGFHTRPAGRGPFGWRGIPPPLSFGRDLWCPKGRLPPENQESKDAAPASRWLAPPPPARANQPERSPPRGVDHDLVETSLLEHRSLKPQHSKQLR